MRKRLLNQLNLTRKQRWFLVLFALVLLPMGTWGQTSYGICIGHYEGESLVGVRVTSENATNISGDGITGTVTFDNDSRTLTLNGATINGCIYSFGNITINIVGSNYIAATDTCAAIRCTASAATVGTLIFTSTDDTGKLTMRGNYNPCTEGFSSPTYEKQPFSPATRKQRFRPAKPKQLYCYRHPVVQRRQWRIYHHPLPHR